jgi:hypothetical protein
VDVETATPQLRRLVRLALIGLGTAFAWVVIATLLGVNAGQAHADDSRDDGLLGAVTTLVDRTASGVSGAVSAVATGTTGAVESAVSVAPAAVQQPVREVAKTVGAIVTTVTEPASEVVSGGVVGGITTPVVDVVAGLPVVGAVVPALGLDDAVADLSGTVDGTLGAIVRVVDETGSTVGRPPATDEPADPSVPGQVDDVCLGSGDMVPAATAAADGQAQSARGSFSRSSAAASFSTGVVAALGDTSVFTTMPMSGAPAGGLCPPAASSTGPGGAGPGAWAFAALLPLAAHRAWVRHAGPEDDNLPAAPVGSTDVSPD